MKYFKYLRSKRDAKLYFKYNELNLDLGDIKTELIKLGYISHVEGDRYIEIEKLPTPDKLKEEIEILKRLKNIKNRWDNYGIKNE